MLGYCFHYGRVNKQVQRYDKNLKNSSFGVEKFSFSLGLLLIFNCTEWMKSSVSRLKSVLFGIYCLISLSPLSAMRRMRLQNIPWYSVLRQFFDAL